MTQECHELYLIDGEYSLAYTGEIPWHKLGQKVPANATIQTWIKKSHTDFKILRVPATYFTPEGLVRVVPNRDALIRNDNHAFLSHVSGRYNITQPEELVMFYDSLIKTGGFTMEAVGSIYNGRRVWATARVGREVKLLGTTDKLEAFLLLAGSCDKSSANIARFTNTRAICRNTLMMALSGRGGSKDVRIPHSQKFDPEKVKAELGLVNDTFDEHVKKVETICGMPMNRQEAVRFFLELFIGKEEQEEPEDPISLADAGITPKGANGPEPADLSALLDDVVANTDEEKLKKELKAANADDSFDFKKIPVNTVLQMTHLFENGKGQNLKTAKNTAWGALNAVTEYYDHHVNSKNIDTKLNSRYFGKGARIKEKAFEMIYEKAAA